MHFGDHVGFLAAIFDLRQNLRCALLCHTGHTATFMNIKKIVQ